MPADVVIKNRSLSRRSLSRNMLARSASAAALSLALALGVPAYADKPPKQVSIEAQPLGDAIFELSQQTGATIFVNERLVHGKSSKALNGTYRVEEGLSELLRGSNLTYRDNGDGAYALVQQVEQVEEIDRPEPREREPAIEVDEIVVTGTNIRGVYPSSSPLIVFDKAAIDKTGFATVPDLIQSLPQNFATSTSFNSLVGVGDRNPRLNSSVNLRGLGPDATLNLLNGRRIAPSNEGAAVDISIVPLSAIDRVEVLTDGASAIYGTDAVAGVVNLVLRDDYDGAETSVRYGTVTDGGLEEVRASQIFGKAWDSGNFLLSYEYFNQDNLKARDRDFAASCNQEPLGGGNFCPDPSTGAFLAGTQPGTISGGAGVFTIPSGQDGTSLEFSDLIPGVIEFPNNREDGDIIPSTKRHSAFAAFKQDLSDRVEFFAEGGYSKRNSEARFAYRTERFFVPVSNAFLSQELADAVDGAPGATRVRINYAFAEEFGVLPTPSEVESYFVNSGNRFDLGGDWEVQAYVNFAKNIESGGSQSINDSVLATALASDDPATAFNPFGDGTGTSQSVLDTLLERNLTEFDADILTFGGQADGPIISLPGGDLRAAIGAEHRDEGLSTVGFVTDFAGAVSNERSGSLDRSVTSVFGEIFLPVFGDDNRIPGFGRLEISAGLRYEDYLDIGDTTNPKVGLLWSPMEGLDFRGTFGTSFQAPVLSELDESLNEFVIFFFPDPASSSGLSNLAVFSGGNADLEPETATTWTVGADFSPVFAQGLNLEATYFNIRFENRISVGALSLQEALGDPAFSAQLTRRPTDPAAVAAFEALIAEGFALPGFRGDFSGGAPVGVILDRRLQNLAETEVEGFDVALNYSRDTGYGSFNVGATASLLTEFDQRATASAETDDVLDTIFNPNNFRLRGTAGWSNGDLELDAFVNFTSGYDDNQLGDDQIVAVGSWTTVDVSASYDLGGLFDAKALNDTTVRLSVQNVLNQDPPFISVDGGQGQFAFDPTQASPLGRFVAFEIRKVW